MDLRLVVEGLLAGHPELGGLLSNHADPLDGHRPEQGEGAGSCFIVPTWDVDRRSSAARLLTVEVHASRHDLGRHEELARITELLHAVLVGDDAGRPIVACPLRMSVAARDSGAETVLRIITWRIAPASPDAVPTPVSRRGGRRRSVAIRCMRSPRGSAPRRTGMR